MPRGTRESSLRLRIDHTNAQTLQSLSYYVILFACLASVSGPQRAAHSRLPPSSVCLRARVGVSNALHPSSFKRGGYRRSHGFQPLAMTTGQDPLLVLGRLPLKRNCFRAECFKNYYRILFPFAPPQVALQSAPPRTCHHLRIKRSNKAAVRANRDDWLVLKVRPAFLPVQCRLWDEYLPFVRRFCISSLPRSPLQLFLVC